LGLDGVLLMFAFICICGALIEIFFIPETRGKNLYAEDNRELKEMNDMSDKQTMVK
jgi:hypothetical protein